MKRSGYGWVSLLALTVAACGSSGSKGGSPTDGGGAGGQGPQSIIDLRVDNNRNGVIDLDDPTEDEGEETWAADHGAVFLANMDDDSLRCPKDSEAAQINDLELAKCFDGADEVVNGDLDLEDMARIQLKPWPDAPENSNGTLTISAPAVEMVRIFKNVGGNWEVLPQSAFLTYQELRAGVELAIEGKDILRDNSVWDGYADLTLAVEAGTTPDGEDYPDGSDTVRLRIAPLLLSHHLQAPEEIYATVLSSTGSNAFRQDLSDAASAAGVPAGLYEVAVADQWTQDFMEIGYMSMPSAGGAQKKIDVFMRSVNVESKSTPASPLRKAGRVVYTDPHFHGVDTAGLTPDFDINHPGSMDSLNSYGDTETIPPYEFNGQSYPMGRVFRGSIPNFHPDPEMQRMLDSQLVQPILNVDTSWLAVGHVDETTSFLKMSNSRGWGMAINDAAMAKKMLEDLEAQGNGDVPIFEGLNWLGQTGSVPAQTTASEILLDADVMGPSKEAEVEVDAQQQILENEIGLTAGDFVPVPFLHWLTYGYSVAYQVGTVNGIYLSDGIFGAPAAHGPIVNGADPFKVQLETAMSQHGITVHWIEDWDLYHRLLGEVHCGSNTKRALPTNAKWWESGL